MKNLKRILALILSLCILASFSACHKQGEIAVEVEDVKFTSAYYMCALMNADNQARTKIHETLTESEKLVEVDYFSKKIDGKKYTDWVKDTAIEDLTEYAAYKLLCKKNKLEIDKETLNNIEQNAYYYWSNYGYASLYEPNGISLATYRDYMVDSYYSQLYFEFIYGEEGEKAIADADVETKLYSDFLIADILDAKITEEMTETQIAELRAKLNNYVTALNDGSKTFKQVYNEYNNINAEPTEEHDHEHHEGEEEEKKPLDENASIIGAKGTGFEMDQYDTIKAMAVNEVKLIELENKGGFILVVKKDIKADEYYRDYLDMTVRHLLKDDEYKKEIDAYAKNLKIDINKYAIGQFKVKKIIYPEQ